jgi:hypothetical protein
MKIIWKNWKIEEYKKGPCYAVKKRVGKKGRWLAVAYHVDLQRAVMFMLDERIRTETTDCIIDASSRASAALGNAKLLARIKGISDDIVGAIS